MSLIKEVLVLRRRAPELSDRWRSTGLTVVGPRGEIIARFTKPALANLVATAHNTWLELSNQWILALQAVQDRAHITAVQQEDAKLKRPEPPPLKLKRPRAAPKHKE